jgi:WhiB family redox-sensing transcriptional regulator
VSTATTETLGTTLPGAAPTTLPGAAPTREPGELPCRVADADLWFAEVPAELELAKALCAECPARQRCLLTALERGEPWGVWGGEIFERGVVVARKRPRGRPRKDARPALTGSAA